jgi:gamma-glutamylcyclotransferase (GGCT)/AIG2-like uncharacterized protein YtfP
VTAAVFVYGTLMPGQPRWPQLAGSAAGEPAADRVRGVLLDTGAGYPGLLLGGDETWVPGVVVRLPPRAAPAALRRLDRTEGVEHGLNRRGEVCTERGVACWTYEYLRGRPSMRRIDRWPVQPPR